MLFLLVVCVVGILAFSSVSANDLNETDASLVNGDYELDFTDSSEKLETGEVETLQEEPKNITVSDKTFAGITNAINSANDGDTIILDGKYDQGYTILEMYAPLYQLFEFFHKVNVQNNQQEQVLVYLYQEQ